MDWIARRNATKLQLVTTGINCWPSSWGGYRFAMVLVVSLFDRQQSTSRTKQTHKQKVGTGIILLLVLWLDYFTLPGYKQSHNAIKSWHFAVWWNVSVRFYLKFDPTQSKWYRKLYKLFFPVKPNHSTLYAQTHLVEFAMLSHNFLEASWSLEFEWIAARRDSSNFWRLAVPGDPGNPLNGPSFPFSDSAFDVRSKHISSAFFSCYQPVGYHWSFSFHLKWRKMSAVRLKRGEVWYGGALLEGPVISDLKTSSTGPAHTDWCECCPSTGKLPATGCMTPFKSSGFANPTGSSDAFTVQPYRCYIWRKYKQVDASVLSWKDRSILRIFANWCLTNWAVRGRFQLEIT